MKKKLRSIMGSIGVIVSLSPAYALADDFGFIGAAGVQLKSLTMSQTRKRDILFSTAFDKNLKGELSALLPVFNAQGIAFYNNWYTVLKLEYTMSSQEVDSTIRDTTEGTSLQTDVSREDYSLSIGYKITDAVSLFGGYMYGKTEITPQFSPCDGTLEGCLNSASRMYSQGYGKLTSQFKEDGLFGGITYGWDIHQGKLSASLGYAYMQGIYESNLELDDLNALNLRQFKFEGYSIGYSAALSWAAPITNNVIYFLDARYQQYSMDAEEILFSDLITIKATTNETIFGLSSGLQIIF